MSNDHSDEIPPSDAVLSSFDLDLLRALADPVRLQIISRLVDQPETASVSDLTACCGIDFSGVSRHLKHLRKAGIVKAVKAGRETRYSLQKESLSTHLKTMVQALD